MQVQHNYKIILSVFAAVQLLLLDLFLPPFALSSTCSYDCLGCSLVPCFCTAELHRVWLIVECPGGQ